MYLAKMGPETPPNSREHLVEMLVSWDGQTLCGNSPRIEQDEGAGSWREATTEQMSE